VSLQCLGSNHSELQILIYWAIEAQNEYKDADARMFGSSYTMMSVSMRKGFSCGDILDLLKESDMLVRALYLFLIEKKQKRQSHRQ
jgi:hypothetical protein